MRALHLHAQLNRKLTDYFFFCRDPFHVIFHVTLKNEAQVAMVTWCGGKIERLIKV